MKDMNPPVLKSSQPNSGPFAPLPKSMKDMNPPLFSLIRKMLSYSKCCVGTIFDNAKFMLVKIKGLQKNERNHRPPVLKSFGHCSTCDREVDFVAYNAWLRDHFVCSNCGSIPRERALMLVIDTYFPNWRDSIIHESSPVVSRGASVRLAKECSHYIPSQFFPDHSPGSIVEGMRCENLEALTFADETIDLHVTQDVLEHVFHPSKVFSEIARTLKPGGMHIFTVPLVNKSSPSKLRARINNGEITYLAPETYHGNPIGDGRSLVTVDWGFDICQHIFESCGLFTQLIHIDDLSRGIRAEYIEVLITFKPSVVEQGELYSGPQKLDRLLR